jgi:hypothetical protein
MEMKMTIDIQTMLDVATAWRDFNSSVRGRRDATYGEGDFVKIMWVNTHDFCSVNFGAYWCEFRVYFHSTPEIGGISLRTEKEFGALIERAWKELDSAKTEQAAKGETELEKERLSRIALARAELAELGEA